MKRLFRSFGYALKGIKSVFRTEKNMKIHVFISILVLIISCLLRISAVEWVAVILCIALVISAEMINTAFETLVDFVSPRHNPIAGNIKDITAGAVFIAAMISVAVGVIIFLPKILKLLF